MLSYDPDLSDLFATTVVVVTAPPLIDCIPLEAESSVIARAVDHRRHEYATVRACARQALEILGHPGAACTAILSGSSREPLWPEGFVGSLTHSKSVCCAVVARQHSALSLGIDVESCDEISDPLISTICSPAELKDASRLTAMTPRRFALLAFSAKESFYKAYFPITRQFLDFSDISLILLNGDEREGRFKVKLRLGLPMDSQDYRFTGKWMKRENSLFTGVTYLR